MQNTRPQFEYRRQAHRDLRAVRDALNEHQGQYIEGEDFYDYPIRVQDMSLDPEEAIDFGPRYCEPLPADTLKAIFEDPKTYKPRMFDAHPEWAQEEGYCREYEACTIQAYFVSLLGSRIYPHNLGAASKWDSVDCEDRYITRIFRRNLHWNMRENFFIADGAHPHLASVVTDAAAPDDRLRLSEILSATHLIVQALKMDRKNEFKVVPVFIYSFSGRNARVLQVHFDGDNLIVRKTEWISFPLVEEPVAEIQLFMRWMMSTPIGETRFSPLPIEGHVEKSGRERGEELIPVPRERVRVHVDA